MKLVLAVLFLACSLFAAGEAGKWSGRILVENANGRVEQLPLVVILKMEDGKVTGSAGPDEARQSPITASDSSGEWLMIAVSNRMRFELLIKGDKATGQAMALGKSGKNRLELTRQP